VQNRIEPPVLLSRLLLFVFAGTVVALFVLAMTIEKMFPLDRPEIFFVTARPEQNALIQIAEMPPVSANMDSYMRAFVTEYLRERNDVTSNTAYMRQKWGTDGVVAMWSSPAVYKEFKKTDMYNAIMRDIPEFAFECPIIVQSPGSFRKFKENEYTVSVRYYCKYNGGQTDEKNYTIRIGLDVSANPTVSWQERLNNPLGIKVSQYVIESGDGDPLDTAYRS
jgi:type IV secretory pathway component VirB8